MWVDAWEGGGDAGDDVPAVMHPTLHSGLPRCAQPHVPVVRTACSFCEQGAPRPDPSPWPHEHTGRSPVALLGPLPPALPPTITALAPACPLPTRLPLAPSGLPAVPHANHLALRPSQPPHRPLPPPARPHLHPHSAPLPATSPGAGADQRRLPPGRWVWPCAAGPHLWVHVAAQDLLHPLPHCQPLARHDHLPAGACVHTPAVHRPHMPAMWCTLCAGVCATTPSIHPTHVSVVLEWHTCRPDSCPAAAGLLWRPAAPAHTPLPRPMWL